MQLIPPPRPGFLKLLLIFFFTSLVLYVGKTLFIPLFFGLLTAIVLYPICKWLENHRWKKPFAIAACLLLVTLLIAALLTLLVWQINAFKDKAPEILNKLMASISAAQQWMINQLHISENLGNKWNENFAISLGKYLPKTVEALTNTLFSLFLIPVFTALFMYHRKVLVECLQILTPNSQQIQLTAILQQTILTYFKFIKGMVLVYIIVGVLNSIGLYALGVPNAILFGMLCAIMTIIPYIGIFISSLLPISVIWLQTGNIWYPMGVIAIFSFVQYLEANVIFPKVVGMQLQVSTLSMLVSVIAGGIIWGVAGMVLFIPFVAILKIISDHIEQWKPINLLLSRK